MNRHRLGIRRINLPGTPDDGMTQMRTGDPLHSTVKVVCVGCNNGWLSQVQNAAKPLVLTLLKGQKTELDNDAQVRLAAWCTMATMTDEYISRDARAVALTQAHRDWLMQHRAPPPGWHV
jgi:hypothetical protein